MAKWLPSLGFDKIDKKTQDMIIAIMMIEEPLDYNDETIILANSIMFDKTQETLDYYSNWFFASDENKELNKLENYLIAVHGLDFKVGDKNQFGQASTNFTFDNISKEQIESMTIKQSDDSVPTIIGQSIASQANLKIGDVFTLQNSNFNTNTSGMESNISAKFKVIGIDKSRKIEPPKRTDIFVDLSLLIDNIVSPNDENWNNGQGLFNDDGELINFWPFTFMWSNRPLLTGKINFTDITGSLQSFKFQGDLVNIKINNYKQKSVLGTIFHKTFPTLTSLTGDESFFDEDSEYIFAPSILSSSSRNIITPFNIGIQTLDQVLKTFSLLTSIFILIQTIIMVIILAVILTIIVEESMTTILTMKSLGYSRTRINWTVMGSYAIWAIMSFIVAFGLSILFWHLLIQFIGSKFGIYLDIPISWEAILISLLLISIITSISYLTSDRQVQKKSLNQITSFI